MTYKLECLKTFLDWSLFRYFQLGISGRGKPTWRGRNPIGNIGQTHFQEYADQKADGAPYHFGPALDHNKWGKTIRIS